MVEKFETPCLWQRDPLHGHEADLRQPVLTHDRENKHGVCSTLGQFVHDVPHHDRGWKTQSERRCVPSRCNGHILANKLHRCRPFAVVPGKERDMNASRHFSPDLVAESSGGYSEDAIRSMLKSPKKTRRH